MSRASKRLDVVWAFGDDGPEMAKIWYKHTYGPDQTARYDAEIHTMRGVDLSMFKRNVQDVYNQFLQRNPGVSPEEIVHPHAARIVRHAGNFHAFLNNNDLGEKWTKAWYEKGLSRFNDSDFAAGDLQGPIKAFYNKYFYAERRDGRRWVRMARAPASGLSELATAYQNSTNRREFLRSHAVRVDKDAFERQAIPKFPRTAKAEYRWVLEGEPTATVGREAGASKARHLAREFRRKELRDEYDRAYRRGGTNLYSDITSLYAFKVSTYLTKAFRFAPSIGVAISDDYLDSDVGAYPRARDDVYRSGNQMFMKHPVSGQAQDINDYLEELARAGPDANNCYNTNKVRGRKCQNYINNCLVQDNVNVFADDNCVRVYNKPELFQNLTAEHVRGTHPEMALRILYNLRFEAKEVYDSVAKRNLLKVEDYDGWAKRLMSGDLRDRDGRKLPTGPGGSDHGSATAIHGNPALKSYLQKLTEHINANPAILNQDYSGATASAVSSLYTSTHEYGLKPKINFAIPKRVDLSDVVARLRFANNRIRLGFNNRMGPFGLLLTSSQVGGRLLKNTLLDQFKSHCSSAKTLRQIYDAHVETLKRQRKDLASSTSQKINALFAQLERSETKLMNVINYIEKYSALVGDKGDVSQKTVGFDALKDAVDKANYLIDKKERRELNIVSILDSILTHIRKDDPSKVVGTVPLPGRL